jgi:hypothetical protein
MIPQTAFSLRGVFIMKTRTRTWQPRLEILEDRTAPATFLVTNPFDSGTGSLRSAIVDANTSVSDDKIVFDTAGSFTTPQTISVLSALPQIAAGGGALTITGTGAANLTIRRDPAAASFRVFDSLAPSLTMTGFTVENGRSLGDDGGGLRASGTTTLDGMVFIGNVAYGSGGAVGVNPSGNLAVRNSIISGNAADRGGGISFSNGGSLLVENSTISGNSSGLLTANSNGGAGISFYGTATATPPAGFTPGTLVIRNSTLANNHASSSGGGIQLTTFAGTLLVQNSTISGNTADATASGQGGGGIATFGTATLTLTDCTLSGNSTGGGGGGIYNVGTATLAGCTLSGNSAGYGGGIANAGTVTLNNSIVANSSKGGDVVTDSIIGSPGALRGSHNLIQTPVTGTGTNSLTNTLTGDPLLGPLADNGGPTLTHALLPGSPAIDAANAEAALALDQRGVGRVGAPDLGAFESRQFTASIQAGGTQSTPVGTAFPSPMVMHVASAFGEPVAGGRLTLSPPATGASAMLSGNPLTIDAAGNASFTATANGTAGNYAVPATANGLTSAVRFRLANTVGTATAVTTDPTVTFRPSAQTVTLRATVTAPQGKPNAGTVTFSVAGAGADVTADVTSGVATATFTVNGGVAPGTYAVSAHYSGAAEFEASVSSGPGGGLLTVERAVTVMTRNLYVGADLSPLSGAIATGNPATIIGAVSTFWAGVQGTNFPQRARALADEIAHAEPLLVGLQEVSLFRTGAPDSFVGNPTRANHVEFDYLEILLAELGKRGLHYAPVAVTQNVDAELPGFVAPGVLRDIRLTDRDVILARTDLPASQLRLSNIQAANFATNLTVPIGATGQSFTNLCGWGAVDVTVRGETFRFINTHLQVESATPTVNAIQVAQAKELLKGPASTSLPVILVGDFNSRADGTGTATYRVLLGAGFNDAWRDTHLGQPGNTYGHDADLRNTTVNFTQRVDLVLYRGGLRAFGADVVGDELADRTPSGLWPSDHGGVVATLGVHVRPLPFLSRR